MSRLGECMLLEVALRNLYQATCTAQATSMDRNSNLSPRRGIPRFIF